MDTTSAKNDTAAAPAPKSRPLRRVGRKLVQPEQTAATPAAKPLASKPAQTQAKNVIKGITVTDNELFLLKAIVAEAHKQKVDPVEMAIPCINPFESKHVGSGTYAAAIRKGLVQSQDYGTKNHSVSLTPEGLVASRYRRAH